MENGTENNPLEIKKTCKTFENQIFLTRPLHLALNARARLLSLLLG